MSNLAEALLESASAVAALGATAQEIAALDGPASAAGLAVISQHRRNLQAYEALFAAGVARASSHELGNSGLARSHGSPTPAHYIQSITGASLDEATRLAQVGTMIAEADVAAATELDRVDPATGGNEIEAPLAQATLAGDISIAAAAAIRKGLGEPDAAIPAAQLREAERQLLAEAGASSPERLLKLARLKRYSLEGDAVDRDQKKRSEIRYVRTWQRDGMSGGSWSVPDEDGGADINTALKLALASRTGGPRFPETDAEGNPVTKSAAKVVLDDVRTMDQVLADAFVQIMINGLRVDPTVVPGAWRAPVRVMVTEKAMLEGKGVALLEDSLSAITFEKMGEYLCEGGQIGILFDERGQLLDVGREQRLFTKAQRIGMATRDGGCRFPGSDKPPSWTEAHHIIEWFKKKVERMWPTAYFSVDITTCISTSQGQKLSDETIRTGLNPGQKLIPVKRSSKCRAKTRIVAAIKYLAAV